MNEFGATRGTALASPIAASAGQPTIFRTDGHAVPGTHTGTMHALDHTQRAVPPTAYLDSPRATAAAPQLAYSMTGGVATWSDYGQDGYGQDHGQTYQAAAIDYSAAQGPYVADPYAGQPHVDDSAEQAPEQPRKKPLTLIGSLVAGIGAITFAALATTVVVGVTPTADQQSGTPSSQQPVVQLPVGTKESQPSVEPPPPPAPPVVPVSKSPAVVPVPKAPVTPRRTAPTGNTNRTPVNQAPPSTNRQPPPVDDPAPTYDPDYPPSNGPDSRPPTFFPPDGGDGPRRGGDPTGDRSPFTPKGSPFTPGGSPFTPGGGGDGPGNGGCLPLLPC